MKRKWEDQLSKWTSKKKGGKGFEEEENEG
jgi:hypothetical protein